MAWQCYNARVQVEAQLGTFSIGLDMQDELAKEHGEPLGDLLEIPLSKEDPS